VRQSWEPDDNQDGDLGGGKTPGRRGGDTGRNFFVGYVAWLHGSGLQTLAPE
jgi:hypothetical protein